MESEVCVVAPSLTQFVFFSLSLLFVLIFLHCDSLSSRVPTCLSLSLSLFLSLALVTAIINEGRSALCFDLRSAKHNKRKIRTNKSTYTYSNRQSTSSTHKPQRVFERSILLGSRSSTSNNPNFESPTWFTFPTRSGSRSQDISALR